MRGRVWGMGHSSARPLATVGDNLANGILQIEILQVGELARSFKAARSFLPTTQTRLGSQKKTEPLRAMPALFRKRETELQEYSPSLQKRFVQVSAPEALQVACL